MLDKESHNDHTEMTAENSECFYAQPVAVIGCQPLLVDTERDRSNTERYLSVTEMQQSIQQHLGAMRTLIEEVKEKEQRGENQESEIIGLQPKLRDHCRRARETWADMRDCLDYRCGATEEEIETCLQLRKDIDSLRNERVLLYSRCRQRHSSALLNVSPMTQGLEDASSRGSNKGKSFWKHVHKMKKKQMKKHGRAH